jgi:predicted enzyme related to lactoylglutathione lyase
MLLVWSAVPELWPLDSSMTSRKEESPSMFSDWDSISLATEPMSEESRETLVPISRALFFDCSARLRTSSAATFETFAAIAGTGSFDGCVKRKQVGLIRDLLDDLHPVFYIAAGIGRHSQATSLCSERLRQAGSGLCPASMANYRAEPFISRARPDIKPQRGAGPVFLVANVEHCANQRGTIMDKRNRINCFDFIEFPAGNVKDSNKLKDFYKNLFGWSYNDWGDKYCDTHSSGLSSGINADPRHRPRHPLAIIYAIDLEGVREKVIESRGVITQEIFSFPGGRRFHFTDPSGNELAVWSDK